MADNLSLTQGSGTLLATDEILGVHVLRAKVQIGADGSADDVSADNPLPVSIGTLPNSTNHLGSVDIDSLPDVTLGAPLPAGTNAIGTVGVTSLPPLPAGSNAIGSVTVSSLPGLTIGSPLPAGTNHLGDVGVTMLPALAPGTNNIGRVDVASLPSVTVGTALPAGANNIGHVDVASLPNVTIGSALPVGTNKIGGVDVLSLPPLANGSNAIGSVSVSSLPNVTIGAALPAGSNTIGRVDVTSIAAGTNTIGSVGIAPATSGGLSIFKAIGLVNAGQLVKNAAGQVFGWHISYIGGTASGVYVKLYNRSVAPTVGTDTPVAALYVPLGSTSVVHHGNGIAFSAGIGIAATTGMADGDATSPGASAVVVNIFYK